MKNKKYKINMKGLLLGLGGAVTVIAPVATLVACGGSNDNSQDPNLGGLVSTMTVDDSNIKALPHNLSPYSVSELFADATKFGDKAMWNRGVAYHSLGSTVSFIKGLAEAYGWDRHDYATKNGILVIDSSNENQADLIPATDPKHIEVEALQDMKVKATPMTDAQKRELYFETGDDGAWNNYDLVNLENTTYTHGANPSGGKHSFVNKADNTKKVDVTFGGAGGEYFTDIKNPGNTTVEVYDGANKISRVLTLKDSFSAFPILTDAQLHDEIAPYAKALIEKFLQMYKSNKGLANGRIAAETLDQIEFLIDKNTVIDSNNPNHKTFAINDAVFNQKLKDINNGSTHWLALKAFFRGLDKSFVSGGFEIYNNYGGLSHDNAWKTSGFLGMNSTHLTGVKDMNDIMGLTDWAHWNQSFDPNLGRMNFVAGMTLEENDTFNGYTAKRQTELTDLIAKNSKYLLADTSTNALWTTYDTNGKTFSEVSQIILKHMLLEKEMKYILDDPNGKWKAVTNVDSKTMDEIQQIIAKNKVLELFAAKYLVGIDVLTKTADEIKEMASWNKFKEVNADLITIELSAKGLTQSDLDAHKDEITTAVNNIDLSSIQALIDGQKALGKLLITSPLTKWNVPYKDGDDMNDVIVKSPEYGSVLKPAILKLITDRHQTSIEGTGPQARHFIYHSSTVDTISATLKFDTKTANGESVHHSVDLTFYRH